MSQTYKLLSTSGGGAYDGKQKHTLTYCVESTTPIDHYQAATVPGINFGDQYFAFNTTLNCYCTNYNSTPDTPDCLKYTVTFDYESIPYENVAPSGFWDAKESLSFANYNRAIDRDIEGNKIVNTNNLPPEDAKEIEEGHLSLTIRKKYNTVNAITMGAYYGAVNADNFRGAPARSWRVMDIRASEKQYDEVNGEFYEHEFQLQYNPDGWKLEFLSQGLQELDDDGNLQDILIKGQPADKPYPLDSEGKYQEDAEHYQTYYVYKELPFSGVF